MPFTQATITHTFEAADGSGASGSVTFSLTKRMTNGTLSLVPSEISAPLSSIGALSQALTANNDPGTIPGDAQWRVELRIATPGSPLTDTFFITVPTGGGTVDLGTLLPQSGTGG